MEETFSIINDLYKSSSNQYEVFNGLKSQIDNIIHYIDNEKENINPKNELIYIQYRIDKLIKEIEDNKNKFDKLCLHLCFKYKIGDIEVKEPKWGDYIKYTLLNGIVKENEEYRYYRNILNDAAIYSKNGTMWACTNNLSNIQVKEIEKLNEIFESNKNNIDKIEISGKSYNIIDSKPDYLIIFKNNNNDDGGVVAKIKSGYIFGLYNPKSKCKVFDQEKNQNQVLCCDVVKGLAFNLIFLGF